MQLLDFDVIIQGEQEPPYFSPEVLRYLNTIFSASYQMRIGTLQRVVSSGASEPYALGFLSGLNEAGELLRQLEQRQVGEWNETLSTFASNQE